MVYHHQHALDATFGALSDPTRREILSRLALGERTIKELAARFDMTLPAVSKHVHVLRSAGLADVQRDGRVRRVRLTPAPMRTALEWIEHYRAFWESELALLAAYLEDVADDISSPSPESPWPPRPHSAKKTARRRPSKSGAPSARRGSASSTRGRKRKS